MRLSFAAKRINDASRAIIAGTNGGGTLTTPSDIHSELECLQRLARRPHDNIVRYYDSAADHPAYWLFLEECNGCELFWDLCRQPHGTYMETTCKTIMRSLLDAVAHLHDIGIVHRDIKLENCYVREEDSEDSDDRQGRQLKLLDFGLAYTYTPSTVQELTRSTSRTNTTTNTTNQHSKPTSDRRRGHRRNDSCTHLTRCMLNSRRRVTKIVGTLSYMSPEIVRKIAYDTSSDVWSCGVLMYIMLSGYLPFDGGDDQIHQTMHMIQHGDVSFVGPMWSRVHPSAVDLVKQLLCKPLEHRCVHAMHALKHTWFTIECGDGGGEASANANANARFRAPEEDNDDGDDHVSQTMKRPRHATTLPTNHRRRSRAM